MSDVAETPSSPDVASTLFTLSVYFEDPARQLSDIREGSAQESTELVSICRSILRFDC